MQIFIKATKQLRTYPGVFLGFFWGFNKNYTPIYKVVLFSYLLLSPPMRYTCISYRGVIMGRCVMLMR
jgi:hypothetical protein